MDIFQSFQKKSLLSHKKQRTTASRGQSRALLRSPRRSHTGVCSLRFSLAKHDIAARSIRRLHHPILNAACLMVVRPIGTHVLPAQNKSDKNTFSKFNFSPLKTWKNRCFSGFMGYLWKKIDNVPNFVKLLCYNLKYPLLCPRLKMGPKICQEIAHNAPPSRHGVV